MPEQPVEFHGVAAADKPTRGRILVIDDEADIRESLETLLDLEGYTVHLADCAMDGLRKLESGIYDLILLDLMMPDRSGLDLLADIRARDIETPVFLITAYGSIDVAVQALKAGANDFIPKPWDNDKLVIEIDRQIAGARLERENRELRRALKQRYAFPNIVGKSERMQRVLDLVSQVAPSKSNILITGETGTGKELIAKAIHANSPRADRPFVGVNSGSLPPDLLESTLFGHVKGAFTGAVANRKGYFETANRGTIFFDEIGTLSADMQVKLLRVLQEREFMPVGSADVIRVDVRVIAATNADLSRMVDDGRFRQDLYYRLNVINIPLPPLRDRKDDVEPLAMHFLKKYSLRMKKKVNGVSPEALACLCGYDWPGNIRELENVIERAVILARTDEITPKELPIWRKQPETVAKREVGLISLENVERDHIERTLANTGYHKSKSAEILGISRKTLDRKIVEYSLSIPT